MNCNKLIAVFQLFGSFVFLDIASLIVCCACSVYDPGFVYYRGGHNMEPCAHHWYGAHKIPLIMLRTKCLFY
jgi:hypothetical protein